MLKETNVGTDILYGREGVVEHLICHPKCPIFPFGPVLLVRPWVPIDARPNFYYEFLGTPRCLTAGVLRSMVAVQEERVLVVGAGAAGLLIAQALKKHDIAYVVFEQDASQSTRPRDWNYGIYWAQSNLLECLPPELADKLLAVQVDSHTPDQDDVLPVFNATTGDRMVDLPAPFSLRLQRRKFLQLIATGIDIQYSKRLINVESDGTTVTATFEDGSSESGTLLIGAEGAHSQVREYLMGKEKAALLPSPIVASATITHLPKEAALALRKLHSRHCIAFHPDGYFSWHGIHSEEGEPEDWQFMIILSWLSETDLNISGDAINADYKERISVFGDPLKTILQSISPDTRFWHNRLSYWLTQPWDSRSGTITLAGDAAHPMTFRLNNAILDAASFARQIKPLDSKLPGSLSAAATAYEKELWQRGKEAVETSNLNSMSIHDWEKLKESPLFQAGLKQKLPGQ
ncbi:FAD/NAD(P)-binding domain-containing protein [Zopfia rhizophila CBS 207.26]|uniref:FAD/NAD(P)-binding domain-containing protein n=1 Tax=Zopfia rhizophila CBS 207.26 TaxID=1314779 RepID=A0A6A6ERX9_9PEZI|nr:FAD/NAD(P)-binding domain-containing protein [Zopfia rhizophila CBS 207.26]